MVGLIQKILFDMIKDIADEDTLRKIKEEAGVPIDKEFQINMVYSDEEWHRLLNATLKVLKITPEEADKIYAKYFMQDSINRFPQWFNMSKNSFEFLSIQPTIHNCFATGVADQKSRDVINDKFKVETFPEDKKLITHYRSPNKHCGLYKALANSVIEYYKDEAAIEETKCLKHGDSECEIHINWSRLGS